MVDGKVEADISDDTDVPAACGCPSKNPDVDPDEQSPCPATTSGGWTFGCTRPRGHDGPHSACGVNAHPIVAWAGGE